MSPFPPLASPQPFPASLQTCFLLVLVLGLALGDLQALGGSALISLGIGGRARSQLLKMPNLTFSTQRDNEDPERSQQGCYQLLGDHCSGCGEHIGSRGCGPEFIASHCYMSNVLLHILLLTIRWPISIDRDKRKDWPLACLSIVGFKVRARWLLDDLEQMEYETDLGSVVCTFSGG